MGQNRTFRSQFYLIGLTALLFSHLSWAKPIRLNVMTSQSILKADKRQTIYLKISLTGSNIENEERTPANIGLVLDKSGSMNGMKLIRAKEAAIMAIKRLGSEDIASIIAYNDYVEVILPATKVIDKAEISRSIKQIYPSGATALFAGVSKGAEEVRKFINGNQINRVILLSDGQANVGPRSPRELGLLGDVLGKEGISITTIGLGASYNEDLMQNLARHSGGNHAYAENAGDLSRIFQNEFNDVLSVVARDVRLRIQFMPGITPIRVLGRSAYINGLTVEVDINQIYSKQEKFIILSVDIPPVAAGRDLQIAVVSARYNNLQTKLKDTLTDSVKVRFSQSERHIENSVNNHVMTATVEILGAQENARAISLRDQGKINEAKRVLNNSANLVRSNASRYQSKRLEDLANKQFKRAGRLQEKHWNVTRKKLRRDIHKLETQQSW